MTNQNVKRDTPKKEDGMMAIEVVARKLSAASISGMGVKLSPEMAKDISKWLIAAKTMYDHQGRLIENNETIVAMYKEQSKQLERARYWSSTGKAFVFSTILTMIFYSV